MNEGVQLVLKENFQKVIMEIDFKIIYRSFQPNKHCSEWRILHMITNIKGFFKKFEDVKVQYLNRKSNKVAN